MIARWLLAVLVALSACVPQLGPAPGAEPGLSEGRTAGPLEDMTDVLARTELPQSDLFSLTRRLRDREGTPGPWQPVRLTVPDRQVGDRDTFFFYDHDTKRHERLTATLRHRTEHAYWYVDETLSVNLAALVQTALEFEGKIYPTDRRLYGEEWSPGIDNDPRITILMGRFPRIAGSFSEADEYPRWVHPFSNEREMVVINIQAVPPGSTPLLSVLAHEFAHMIQFNTRRRAVVWFLEGQAQLAEHANGFSLAPFVAQFLRAPDTQLNDWPDEPRDAAPHYGHAFLLLQYLAERFGGTELIRELMARGVDTTLDLDAALRRRDTKLEDAYLDFVAANGLLERPDAPAPYRVSEVRPPRDRVPRDAAPDPGTSKRGTVHQFAARYIELPAGRLRLDFRGARQVRLIPTEPHGGRYLWWSNRADKIDTTLTRRVDLRAVRSATLRFWTWFEIEEGWDYAYVTVSDDGGTKWRTLQGTLTTNDDPNGNNLGNGITGRSGGSAGPAWVEERMDLTPYTGKEVLLRFEYVTDLAVNKNGFAVDDLSIPEVGWRDDAERASDWDAKGFVRSTNVVRQGFGLQLLRTTGEPAVQRIPVGADGGARVDVDVPAPGGVLLAVTGFALQSTQPASFELRLDRR